MYRRLSILLALVMTCMIGVVQAQTIEREYDDDYDSRDYRGEGRVRIDRYLDAEVWTDQQDGEYYEGDNISISFRTNRDAFVAIYSIDTRGRVNLLFPTSPNEDNFVLGGQVYRLPGSAADYDLVINGPEGREYIQIVASRERFPIPNWYGNSGLVIDDDDVDYALDDLNERHFVRYDGQRFAYDRTVVFVNEWEPDYFRPVYYPTYPSWSTVGNFYIDYPWGASVYINGIYWGCAPLYVPRILVGWHTITVYDPWGYCWERPVHVTHHHTVILDRTVIRTERHVVSKYKEVRTIGYRDPVKHGYPKYKETIARIESRSATKGSSKSQVTIDKFQPDNGKTRTESTESLNLSKKYVRGSAKVVQSDRGIETIGSDNGYSDRQVKSRKSRSTSSSGADYRSKSGGSSSGSTVEPYRGKRGTETGSSSGRVSGKRETTQEQGKERQSGYERRTTERAKAEQRRETMERREAERKEQPAQPSKGSEKSSGSTKSDDGKRVGSQKTTKDAGSAQPSGGGSSSSGKSSDRGGKSQVGSSKGKR